MDERTFYNKCYKCGNNAKSTICSLPNKFVICAQTNKKYEDNRRLLYPILKKFYIKGIIQINSNKNHFRYIERICNEFSFKVSDNVITKHQIR